MSRDRSAPFSYPFSGAVAVIALGLALTLLATEHPARAQEATQPPAPQPPTEAVRGAQFAEEVRVRLVTLPVLARDRRGRAVTDLKAEEVEVRDGRRRFQVDRLTPFFEPSEDRRNLPAVRLVTEWPGGPQEVIVPTEQEPRYLLLYVDLENDPPIQKQAALQALIQLVDKELDRSYRVGVMVYDGELDLAVPFTQNREVISRGLLEIYDRRRPRATITPELRINQLLQRLEICEDPEDSNHFNPVADAVCLRMAALEYVDEARPRAEAFLDGLEGVVQYLAGAQGHKAVLTLSQGVALDPLPELLESMRAMYGRIEEVEQLQLTLMGENSPRARLERLLQLAFRHDVSLSFLDRSSAPSDFSARQSRVLQAGFRPQMTAFQSSQQDMKEISGATGGVFVSDIRVDEGLRQAIDRIEGGYYLSFYVDDAEPMTARRMAQLKVNALRSGVTLEHRRAFEGARERSSTALPQGTMRGTIQIGEPVRGEKGGKLGDFVPLHVVIDPRDLAYADAGEQMAATLTVHLMVRTRDRVLLADAYHFLTHTYPQEIWKSGRLDAPRLMAWLDAPNGDYLVEALVASPITQRQGSFRRFLMVRNDRKEPMKAPAPETQEGEPVAVDPAPTDSLPAEAVSDPAPVEPPR